MRAIDLFCGAGGLTLGLRRAGWDVVAGIDVDNAVGATYESNNSEAAFMPADLRSVTVEEIRILAGTTPSNELLLAGCAPCQPFSKQRRGGPRNRGEATLLGQFARLVKELEPKVVLMETCRASPRFLDSVPSEDSSRPFTNAGMSATNRPKCARLRRAAASSPIRVVGRRGSSVALPSPVKDAASDKPTVRKTIERFPALDAGDDNPSTPITAPQDYPHGTYRGSERLLPTAAAAAIGPRNWNWPVTERPSDSATFTGACGGIRVAPTLTSRCNSLSNGRFGHPEQNRAISLREAAALQTFPDDYEFFGAKNRIAGWIGNAVPVSFGEALGRAAMTAAV